MPNPGQLVPLRGASVYVYHPSWGYFCDAYGLHQHAIEVEGKDPSDAELTALQAQARRERVKVIFVQPQIAGRSAQAIAKSLGAEVRTLDPLARDVMRATCVRRPRRRRCGRSRCMGGTGLALAG